jgi:hypothetical protein
MEINITENLFLSEDISIFLNETNDIMWETPNEINDYNRNDYNRKNIGKIFGKYKIYLENFLHVKYKKKYYLIGGGVWINKVTPSTNTHDAYHFDDSDLSIVTYLNDDFMGGEFEYINKNGSNIKINPTKGQSLIMDGKTLHRVLPVISGERYSLISFFYLQKKDFKTLL